MASMSWTIDVGVGENNDGDVVLETGVLVDDNMGNVVSDDGEDLKRGVEV